MNSSAGYIVASGLKRSNGVQGIAFIVQSDKPAEFVEKRTEVFLLNAKVNNYIKAVITYTCTCRCVFLPGLFNVNSWGQ